LEDEDEDETLSQAQAMTLEESSSVVILKAKVYGNTIHNFKPGHEIGPVRCWQRHPEFSIHTSRQVLLR
jgi:hypothetical protein